MICCAGGYYFKFKILKMDLYIRFYRSYLFTLLTYGLLIQEGAANTCRDTSTSCSVVLSTGRCANDLYKKVCCQTCTSGVAPSSTTPVRKPDVNPNDNSGNCKDVTTACSVVLTLKNACKNYYYKENCCKTCSGGTRIPNPSVPASAPAPTQPDEEIPIGFEPIPDCGRRFGDLVFEPGAGPILPDRNAFDERIFGGREAMKNSWPWMALLGKIENTKVRWFCGGSLINDEWLLTAAHCLLEDVQIVRLGEHDINKNDPDFPVANYKVETTLWFPNYQGKHNYHDIGLVKIFNSGPLSSRFSPVCLPWAPEFQGNHIGDEALVTGWGATSYLGEMSSVLREVEIKLFDPQRCINAFSRLAEDYKRKWPEGMKKDQTLCAGRELGQGDACQGDSGGPLVVADHRRVTILGVVSSGIGCGHKDYPGIYAPVYYLPYLKWIKRVAFRGF